jgi:hypothetical protein
MIFAKPNLTLNFSQKIIYTFCSAVHFCGVLGEWGKNKSFGQKESRFQELKSNATTSTSERSVC